MDIIKNKLKKKTKNKKGFTLTEVLATTLILLMSMSIVAQGVPVAKESYEKVMDTANAQVLLSTSMTVLRDYIGTATKVSASSDEITFKNRRTGEVTLHGGFDRNGHSLAEDILLPRSLYRVQGLEVIFDSVAYGSGMVTFYGLSVVKSGYDNPLATVETFEIRLVNE